MHSLNDLIGDLQSLGLESGDCVFVHASMRAAGQIDGGAVTLIEALFRVVGTSGLVAMPAFSDAAYFPSDIYRSGLSVAKVKEIEAEVPEFDPSTTHALDVGILAETFRRMPGTVRSNHPSISVCANGSGAEGILSHHSLDWSSGMDGPFGKIVDRPQSKVLLIGVGWNRCTLLHTAEFLAYPRRTKLRRCKHLGQWLESPDVADDLGRLFPDCGAAYEGTGAVRQGQVGDAESRLSDVAPLVGFASDWIAAANLKSGDRH